MLEQIWKLLLLKYIGAKIEDHGSITIPARLVSEFITNLPSGPVELEAKNEHLHITSGKFSSVINGVVADEYPELPTIDEKTAIQYEIDVDDLKKAIVQTKLAVSSDVTRRSFLQEFIGIIMKDRYT